MSAMIRRSLNIPQLSKNKRFSTENSTSQLKREDGLQTQLVFCRTHEQIESSKQPIRLRYLGHMTGHQPIRDQYFNIRSVPGRTQTQGTVVCCRTDLMESYKFDRTKMSFPLSLPRYLSHTLSLPLGSFSDTFSPSWIFLGHEGDDKLPAVKHW